MEMLNEPESESGGQDVGGQEQEPGGGNSGYIQVTPQEKAAIERVRLVMVMVKSKIQLIAERVRIGTC